MITDIPTKADFDNNAIGFLNLAWQSVLSISLSRPKQPVKELSKEATQEQHAQAEEENRRWEQDVQQYWQAVQQELATAVALVQQATEFLLKGKIAAVSPFLLVSGTPADWPRGCDRNDIPFADLKTIDAQDLIRCHDTVCTPRLTDQFKQRFEQLRRLRNSIMHTVDRRLNFTTLDGLLAILEVVEPLIGPNTWLGLREQYLSRQPNFFPNQEDVCRCRMARETVHVIDLLQPDPVRRFFGFDKKQRRYLCPGCEQECANWQIGVTLAQLVPNTAESSNVFCILCRESHEVIRKACGQANCRGNVVSVLSGKCLTCGLEVPVSEANAGQ